MDEHLEFLTEAELARRWRRSIRTLQRWRRAARGPAHLKIGHRILYSRKEIDAYEARRLRPGEGA